MTHATHAALYITTCPQCADEYRAPETDEEPWTPPTRRFETGPVDEPGWPAAWAVLAVGIVALVVFAAAWGRS